ncbi:MAG: IS1595 family transposase [Taibaiella sp.]|nr:IS1595 family transposase [Taibaiella sp.]
MQVSEYFSDRQTCIEYLIAARWGEAVRCAFCNHDKVYTLTGKNKRFKCAKCLRHFSATKGTVLENSPISLQKWFISIYLSLSNKKGISSVQLAKHIDVTQKTAWYMLHRIRAMMRIKAINRKISGLIQIDETFCGGKNKNRPWHKKVKYSQGRSFKDKTPVLGLLDSNGQIRTFVVPDTKAITLKPIIYKTIEKGSIIVTDEWKAYNGLSKDYTHFIVDHSRKQYVNENGFTTNSLEGAWSHLKRMIIGVYHKTSRKHLHRYCDEFTFKYNTRTMSDTERFDFAFQTVKGRLKHRDLVAA